MMAYWLVIPALAAVLFGAYTWHRQRRRQQRLATFSRPFPADWERQLRRDFPLYRRLGKDERRRLQRLMREFLHDKTFYPCDGLTLTPRMQRLIAAQACLLILYRASDDAPLRDYADLNAILVYPDLFQVDDVEVDEYGVVHEQTDIRAGESWERGRVILAWEDVRVGARGLSDGSNVTFHEFAHQLDQHDGRANGAPVLADADMAEAWYQAFSAAFTRLSTQTDEQGLIDPYGATHPAEFFAVVTEVFFEQPHALAHEEPDVFALLQAYYRVDPRRWHPR